MPEPKQSHPTFRVTEFNIYSATSSSFENGLIDFGVELGVINKSGATKEKVILGEEETEAEE